MKKAKQYIENKVQWAETFFPGEPVHFTRPQSSVLKITSFFIFVASALLLFTGLMGNGSVFWNALVDKTSNTGDKAFFINAFRGLFVCTFLHFLRMYISLEMVENPFSTFNASLKNLTTTKQRSIESIIRLLFVILVGLNICRLFPQFDQLLNDELKSFKLMSWYVAFLYLICLIWDLFMHKKAKLSLEATFIDVSFPGFVLWLLLAIFSPKMVMVKDITTGINKPQLEGSLVPCASIMSILIFILLRRLIWVDILKKDKDGKRSMIYKAWFAELITSTLKPYTGQKCKRVKLSPQKEMVVCDIQDDI